MVDTLVLMKNSYAPIVLQALNGFHKRGVGVSECSGGPIFFFLLNKVEFAP